MHTTDLRNAYEAEVNVHLPMHTAQIRSIHAR
jgi:hypothetical protein